MESYEKLYNSICRLCLKYNKSDNLVPLFDKTSGNVNCYGKAVATFAAIVFKKEDSLPPSMCKKCLIILKQCIYFKFTCEASDKKLRLLKSLVSENFMQTIVEYTLFKLNNLLNTSDACNNIPKQTINAKKTKINDLAAAVKGNNIKNDNQNSLDSIFSLVQIEDLNATTPKIEKNTEKPNENLDSFNKLGSPNKKLCSDKMAVRPKRKLKRRLRKRFIKNTKNKSLDQETYMCNICNKILANQKTYENHMQRHNGCRFICEHCGKGFPVLAELQNHIVARHGTGPCIQCKLCPFKAYKKFDLIEHERIHTGERPFTCEKCGLTFRRRAIWKNHLIYHTEKQIQCTLCPKKFHRRSQMMVHYNNVHDRMYMYVCAKCDAMYAKPVTVRRHMMDKHGVPREMQGKILRVKKSGLQDIS